MSVTTSPVFGESLEELTKKENSNIPHVVKNTISYLTAHSLDEEGISRIQPNSNLVDDIVQKINNGKHVNFEEVADAHAICAVLKKFLHMLPEPVVKLTNVKVFLDIEASGADVAPKLKSAVNSLPKPNAYLLDYIIYWATQIAERSEKNKMPANYLARVLHTYLLAPKQDMQTLQEAMYGEKVIEDFINNYREIFADIIYEEKTLAIPAQNIVPTSPTLDMYKEFLTVDTQLRKQSDGINLLCLDGGGMRGLASVVILTKLCTKLFGDAKLESTQKLLSCFDLVCGTSTGGIIALALTSGKISLEGIRQLYYTLGKEIFLPGYLSSATQWYRYYTSGGFYNGSILESILTKEFGNLLMSTLPTKVFVTATDTTNTTWKPFLLRSYELPDCVRPGTSNVSIPFALRATSAAPTYFAPFKLGDRICVDGGMIANNPTEFGIFEAHQLWPHRYINLVLSIGTGIPKDGKSGPMNILKLVNAIVDIATSSDLIHKRVFDWCSLSVPKPDYFRLSPPDIGSITLDQSNEKILNEMEKKTEEFLNEQPQVKLIEEIAKIIEDQKLCK